MARRLFAAAIRRLPVTVVVVSPDGHRQVLGQGGPTMTVRRPDEFFARLGRHGLIGFGEAYMTEAWDADDLAGFLTVLAADLPTLVPSSLQKARALVVARPPRGAAEHHRQQPQQHRPPLRPLQRPVRDVPRRDAELLLGAVRHPDPRTDTAGHLVAIPPGGESATEPLAEAQVRKIERLLDRTGVGPGTRLLEIGTGWGELAIRAAQRGASVRSVTLSTEQLELARARVAAAGVADRVQVELRDYRAIEERAAYDAVVSVEMIEAVGHQFWPEYFGTLDRLLAPGGKVGIQAILMPHDRMLATRRTHTWINKYIFPGGFLPSVEAIEQVTREHTTLRVAERLSFGSHYAETLRRWDDAFGAASGRVRELGFDATFQRMWHFYLEYSRAGFASGYLDVEQIILER